MKAQSNRPVLIFDGNNLAWRAYHAIGGLSRSDGHETAVTFGVLRMLFALIVEVAPSEIHMVFDGGKSPIRLEMYPEYKKRKPKDEIDLDSFYAQLKDVRSFLQYIPVNYWCGGKVEADDVVYLLARENDGKDVVVVSTDDDFYQLVSQEGVQIFSPVKDIWVDQGWFNENYSFSVELFARYKAIVGDSSDNIKGVPDIGEVNAAVLFEKALAACECLPCVNYAVFDKTLYDMCGDFISEKRAKLLRDNWDVYQRNISLIEFGAIAEQDFERACAEGVMEAFVGESRLKTFFSLCERFEFDSFLKKRTQYSKAIYEMVKGGGA